MLLLIVAGTDPCGNSGDDRHVGIVYQGSQAHLVFEQISLAELLSR